MTSDPLFLRSVELLLAVCGGILFGYLGYRLFIFGVREGNSHLEAESRLFKVVFSGTAPGLFFMFAGAAILVAAILVKASDVSTTRTTQTKETVPVAAVSTAEQVTAPVATQPVTADAAAMTSRNAVITKTTTTVEKREEKKKH
jgi:hypothetical protein